MFWLWSCGCYTRLPPCPAGVVRVFVNALTASYTSVVCLGFPDCVVLHVLLRKLKQFFGFLDRSVTMLAVVVHTGCVEQFSSFLVAYPTFPLSVFQYRVVSWARGSFTVVLPCGVHVLRCLSGFPPTPRACDVLGSFPQHMFPKMYSAVSVVFRIERFPIWVSFPLLFMLCVYALVSITGPELHGCMYFPLVPFPRVSTGVVL